MRTLVFILALAILATSCRKPHHSLHPYNPLAGTAWVNVVYDKQIIYFSSDSMTIQEQDPYKGQILASFYYQMRTKDIVVISTVIGSVAVLMPIYHDTLYYIVIDNMDTSYLKRLR